MSMKLIEAVHEQDIELVNQMLHSGADVNAVHPGNGCTPLHISCMNGDIEMTKLLLDNGADMRIMSVSGGIPPINEAILYGHCECAKILVEHGMDVNYISSGNETLLHTACSLGYENIVQLLIDNGADVNAVNYIGYTPLHNAAFGNDDKCARVLIRNGADITAKSEGKFSTPLEIALTLNNNPKCANVMYKHYTEFDITSTNGKYIVERAMHYKWYDIIDHLILIQHPSVSIPFVNNLVSIDQYMSYLYPEIIINSNLSSSDWDLIPNDCIDIEYALYTVLERHGETGLLVKKMTKEARDTLQTMMLSCYKFLPNDVLPIIMKNMYL